MHLISEERFAQTSLRFIGWGHVGNLNFLEIEVPGSKLRQWMHAYLQHQSRLACLLVASKGGQTKNCRSDSPDKIQCTARMGIAIR